MQGTREETGWFPLLGMEVTQCVYIYRCREGETQGGLKAQSEEVHPLDPSAGGHLVEDGDCSAVEGKGLDTHKRSKEKREVAGVNSG